MSNVAVIGTGNVGLVTGACLAELGHCVVCLDTDVAKISQLRAGCAPFYEPRLLELVARNREAGRLDFSSDITAGVRQSDIIFIAVGTPAGADGHADVSAIRNAAAAIGRALNGPKIVVSKSTVPIDTGTLIAQVIAANAPAQHAVDVVSNPEFLREGSAIVDFMHPDRIVIGTSSAVAAAALRDLYSALDAPFVISDGRTSEMIKYAANAFLATKISFMNEIANICDLVGIDVTVVAHGMGLDRRIGTASMQSGAGYGGSCLPKDVRALTQIAADHSYGAALLSAVQAVNERQVAVTLQKLSAALGDAAAEKTVAVLGLSFKPDTDDIREAPALRIIEALLDARCRVRVHDPAAMENARTVLGDRVTYCTGAADAARGADALFLATEWNEYKKLDFPLMRSLMRGHVIVDGRNIYDPSHVAAAGLNYIGVGRPSA